MRLDPAAWVGRTVEVEVDRPAGSRHPDHPALRYPINYGFVPGTRAADGEPIDVYLLGTREPLRSASGRVVAVVRRDDDVEDKLVVALDGERRGAAQIAAAVDFQERYFKSRVLGVEPED